MDGPIRILSPVNRRLAGTISFLIAHKRILTCLDKVYAAVPLTSVFDTMAIEQRMHFQAGLLTVVASGVFSLKDAKQAFLEMLGAVAHHKAETILLDGRSVKGQPDDLERFFYGAFAARETLRIVVSIK